jgi:hypothetical protein
MVNAIALTRLGAVRWPLHRHRHGEDAPGLKLDRVQRFAAEAQAVVEVGARPAGREATAPAWAVSAADQEAADPGSPPVERRSVGVPSRVLSARC